MSRTMTISRNTMLGLGAGLLVVGVLVGAAGAQVIEFARPRFLNTGLFSIEAGEGANFHVALDDRAGGPPARVLLQLFNHDGDVVARQEEPHLEAGKSTTLAFRAPGLYSAHAQILEPTGRLGGRRIMLGTLEIGSLDTATLATAGVLSIRAPIRFACSSDDGSDNGRNPD